MGTIAIPVGLNSKPGGWKTRVWFLWFVGVLFQSRLLARLLQDDLIDEGTRKNLLWLGFGNACQASD